MIPNDDTQGVQPIGPLQLRVMHAVWKRGETTVSEVFLALNAEPGAKRLAYTTFLTVMRNLVRRGLLAQENTGLGKAHRFRPLLGEEAYKTAFLRQIVDDYFGGDTAQLLRHLDGAKVP
jgi:predicted transcriptional regulator